MKTTILLASTVLGGFAGCSDEADIGVDSNPITCSDGPIAEVAGSVENPADGTSYDFDTAFPSASLGTANGGYPTAQLYTGGQTTDAPQLLLRFGFYCGAAEIAQYGVIGDGQTQQLECPFQVATAMLGRIEYLPASSGVLYVDEVSNCLAARFRVDFGDHGAVGGWFSTPYR